LAKALYRLRRSTPGRALESGIGDADWGAVWAEPLAVQQPWFVLSMCWRCWVGGWHQALAAAAAAAVASRQFTVFVVTQRSGELVSGGHTCGIIIIIIIGSPVV
jgi:hypothetical protein